MRLSFDDEESFKEAAESLRFNNPPSDRDTHQQMGSSGSMPLQDSERNDDNIIPSDPNTLRRVGSSSSILPQERSGDSHVYFNDPSGNPEYTNKKQ